MPRPPLLRELQQLPNLLSLARLPLGLLFPLALPRAGLALGVLLGAAASDVLDGWLARRRGQASKLGRLLDPLTDKAFVVLVLGSLLGAQRLPPWSVLPLLARELVQLPLGLWMVARRFPGRLELEGPSLWGKATTALQFGALAGALVAPPVVSPLLVFVGLLGLTAGLSYVQRVLRLSRRRGASLAGQGPP